MSMVTLWWTVLAQASSIEEVQEQQAIYVPGYRDEWLLDRVQKHIDTFIDEGDRNYLTYLLVQVRNVEAQFADDPQAAFILYQIGIMLDDAVKRIDDNEWLYIQREVVDDELNTYQEPVLEEESSNHSDDEDDDLPPVVEVPTPLQEYSRSAFLDIYMPYMKGTDPLYDQCFTHYAQIDQVAKQENFPTALIIATRYREHSCFMSNPANGRGNFQITSHKYPEGEIGIEAFLVQVQEFIDFSRAKRDYYDAVQKFGPEPITLEYDNFDISSIRKHAIFYNGVYPDVTLDKSRYSNENFTWMRGGRDGIVAAFLKVLQWERENGYIE